MHRESAQILTELGRSGENDRYRIAVALRNPQAQQGRNGAVKAANVLRYLEPTLVPVAAALWLNNLMLILW